MNEERIQIRVTENGFVADNDKYADEYKEWVFTNATYLADFIQKWAQENQNPVKITLKEASKREEDAVRGCDTCKHQFLPMWVSPCAHCSEQSNWEEAK